MKIRPVILCGGAGTRLWPKKSKHQAKQFIDFGGWTLINKTFERVKSKVFDYPIISTNSKYLRDVKKALKKSKIKKYKIILEPAKKNTAPAILASALIKDVPYNQPLMYFAADHLIEKPNKLITAINKNKSNLDEKNVFIFGIKPTSPSSEYGYFITKKKKNINKVTRFIEKPKVSKAKQVIKQSNVYYLNKQSFSKATAKSFDYAILEKTKNINAIKLDIPWSDLGSWKEICKMYGKIKNRYFKKKNVFHRPWGSYTNLFKGKEFLIKELYVKSKGILSLQKHFHRSEHWVVTHGIPRITLNKSKFLKKPGETIYIPLGAVHRIENPFKKPVKIIEAQIGSILKETDIVRYQDVYGRVK